MEIGTKSANSKGKELSELPKETKAEENSNSVSNSIGSSRNTSKNGQSRRNRRRQKKVTLSPVQRLYDTCQDVFAIGGAGVIPSPKKIEQLRAVLDDIKPVDVGLKPELPYFCKNDAITYLHIHECDKFSMGIFCLPPSGIIPLHNHPGMTVFNKLLFGTMHITSYDWVVDVPCNTSTNEDSSKSKQPKMKQQSEMKQPKMRLAKVKVDSDFSAPCNTSILYPADGGNMHCFTAVTACAMLDVLGPPYSDADGRPCTYYLDFPFANFSVDGVSIPEEERESYAWLQEREKPEDVAVVGTMYSGPEIVEK